MKMFKLCLAVVVLSVLGSPGLVEQAEASELGLLAASTLYSAMAAQTPTQCDAAPGVAEIFPIKVAFINPPTGCQACQNHSDCLAYCGGYPGACFRDETFSCSLNRYDKFCFC